MVEIVKANEIDQHLNILLYGDPGVGKTTLAATAFEHEDMQDVLIINVEGGMLSIRSTDVNVTEKINSVSDAEEVLWSVAQGAKGFEKYNTLVVDSGTELQTLDLETIVAAKAEKNKNRDIDEIFIEDYGKSTARLKRFFRMLRDLPCHTIVTALTKRVYKEAKARDQSSRRLEYVGPQFTNKLAQSVMGYMDCVWYMALDEDDEKRLVLTRTEGVYQAKTRGQKFAAEIGKIVENPTLPQIFNLLLETEA